MTGVNQMKAMILSLAVLMTFGGLTLGSDFVQASVETIEVAHYRAYCEGVVPKKCLVVMRQGSMNFGTIFDEIENFEFIPGFHYKLRVEVEKVAAPPKDTSGYKYRLKEIVKRTSVPGPDRDIDLYGSKWRLVVMNGSPVEKASGAWLVIAGHTGRLYGYAGCNSFQGGFRFDASSSLQISPLAVTNRACLVGWGVEDDYLKALGSVDGAEVEQDRLILKLGRKAVLEFTRYE